MKSAAFFLLLMALPGFLWAAPREKRILNLPTSSLNADDIEEVVESHNMYRRLEEAADMKYMSWNQELADAAQAHVDKCVFQHGTMSWDGMSFSTVGQNMFFANFFAVSKDYMVSRWYNEVSYYDYASNKCQDGKGCGHYLQVVWAESDKVGCGVKVCDSMYFPDEDRHVANALFFTCNYNPASFNYLELPYKMGDPCTKCSSGRQWCEDGLCRDCNLISDSEDCECNVQCENCGVKNEKDCTCSCPNGYIGTSCENECSDLSTHCGTSWPAWTCGLEEAKDNVPPKCPKMCGLCTAPTIDTHTCIDTAPGPACPPKDCGVHGAWDDVVCKCLCTTGHYGELCENACPQCVDAYPDVCPTWKGNCNKPAYKNFMDFTCAKTCGTCDVPEGC